MNLFDTESMVNLLPYDGIADYYGKVLQQEAALHYYNCLLHTLQWRHDEAIIFGKHIITKRKVAWYGDSNYAYTYSNTTKQALQWTEELLELKQLAEALAGIPFNSCLLNLYHNGAEGVAWHSDDEKSLGPNTTIASISLGAARKFLFRHKKTKEAASIILESGSLLVMKGSTQTHWLHCLPKSKKILTPRINLTFRTIQEQKQ